MTEGPLLHHDKPMCVRIWLEVGHACEPRRSEFGRALALDWRVWVRGARGRDISAFVHKVVFHLHPATAFVYPKRVLQEPPYEIQESGSTSIDIPIHVYLKYSSRPKKIRLRYSLRIENSTKSSSDTRCVYYDLESPSEELCSALMSGGGELVARARGAKRVLLVLDEPRAKRSRAAPACLHAREPCADCTAAELRKRLRAVHMTDAEAAQVARLYQACTNYERSATVPLELPPLSNPIYCVPELPSNLREMLKAHTSDYPLP